VTDRTHLKHTPKARSAGGGGVKYGRSASNNFSTRLYPYVILRESGRARVTVSGEIARETETDYNITHTHAATKKEKLQVENNKG
jgi:hypothetical protein